jgi:hypothetical protein
MGGIEKVDKMTNLLMDLNRRKSKYSDMHGDYYSGMSDAYEEIIDMVKGMVGE